VRRTFTNQYTILLISCAALLILYLPCINGSGFVIDDDALLKIPQLKAPFNYQLLKTLFTPGTHIDFYPVRDLADWLQVHLLGANIQCLDMTVFRVFGLTSFCLSLLFVYRILSRRLESKTLCAFITMAFALLPYHAETLIWVSAQKDILAILFALIALDQIEAWGLSKTEKSGIRWIWAILFFSLSFLSKASFLLFPFLVFAGIGSGFYPLEGPKRKSGLLYSGLLGAIAVSFILLQLAVYQKVNDMRMRYDFAYRIKASAAALGKETLGLFNSSLNTVDVENWGNWLKLNQQYSIIGLIEWGLFCIAIGYAIRKRDRLAFIALSSLAALYIPVSGLVFEHKNFYSTRYLEPVLFVSCLWIAPLFRHLNQSKVLAWISAAALLGLALLCNAEAQNWVSSRSILEKSLAQQPTRLAIKAQYYSALMQDKIWGRLSPADLQTFSDLNQELGAACGLTSRLDQQSEVITNDDCISTWSKAVMSPSHFSADTFQHIVQNLDSALLRLKPQAIERVHRRMEMSLVSYGLKETLDFDPRGLVGSGGFDTTPDGRLLIITSLCMLHRESDAKELAQHYFDRYLLDNETIRESLPDITGYLLSRRADGASKAERLRSCLSEASRKSTATTNPS
jgi:hypothetical protein